MLGYVNHFKNNGDFTGLSSLPYWDQQTIRDIILPENGTPMHVWCKNKYDVLNKLLWTGQDFDSNQFSAIPTNASLRSYVKEVKGKSWKECKDKWESAEWKEKVPFPASCHVAIKNSSDYHIMRIRSSFRLNTESRKSLGNVPLRAYDVYLRLGTFSSPDNKRAIFIDPDYNSDNRKLIKIIEQPMPDVYPFVDVEVGNYECITLNKPKKKNVWHGWFCKFPENIFLVSKYDVPGGFEFVPEKEA